MTAFNVLCSCRRSTFCVHDDDQRSVFMTTFNVLCSLWRGQKHRPPGPQPPPPETAARWFETRKELLKTSNEVAITRLWPGVVWLWVWAWDRLHIPRLFAGLRHLSIVCQREGHYVNTSSASCLQHSTATRFILTPVSVSIQRCYYYFIGSLDSSLSVLFQREHEERIRHQNKCVYAKWRIKDPVAFVTIFEWPCWVRSNHVFDPALFINIMMS